MDVFFLLFGFFLLLGLVYGLFVLVTHFYCESVQENASKERDTLDIEPKEHLNIVVLAPFLANMTTQDIHCFTSNIKYLKRMFPNTRLIYSSPHMEDFDFLETTYLPMTEAQAAERVEVRNRLWREVIKSDSLVFMVDIEWRAVWNPVDIQRAIAYLLNQPDLRAVTPLLTYAPFGSFFPFSEDYANPTSYKGTESCKQWKEWKEKECIPVDSAFGSFVIYKNRAAFPSLYCQKHTPVYRKPKNPSFSEHVFFHGFVNKMHLLPWFHMKHI